ncbi:hypothetical protein HELRODRAFT_128997, partial [Helobdella robusta]|uniref:Voltage-gated inwardly rectifying potassium channel KCNH3 n=1 Tax=Helobdella robusta TaxID=6412 RepID=T1EHR2_HELRO
MPGRKGLLAPQNNFLDTIATRFDGTHSNFVLGNSQAQGHPIVYCSDGFCELTGYARAQVMSKNCICKFLFGPLTSAEEIKKLETSVETKSELKSELQLYRKNGTMFWCLLDMVPIKNEKGEVVLFLVSHKDITFSRKHNAKTSRYGFRKGSHKGDDGTGNKYQRRRSRAVLYQLSGTFSRQTSAKSKLQLNKIKTFSGTNDIPEYKVQEIKRSRFILLHYSFTRICWDWLILLCTFYIAIMVPYNAAFIATSEGNNQRITLYFDVFVEMLFIIDIIFNFQTTYVNKSGQVIYQPKLIAFNYLRGWFVLDLLAAIPFDLLYAFQVDTGTLIHLLKGARLLRLARLLQKLDRYSQHSFVVLTLLMAMFTVLAHWLACVWYFLGREELLQHPANWTVGWLYQLAEKLDEPIVNKTNLPPISVSYVSALYFTCTSLTSVGFGNVSPNTTAEKIFSVIAMLIGALMHALVFGNVTAIIQRMYARRAIYQSKTRDLKDFFRAHHIPAPLKQRMQEYFQTTWSLNSGIDRQEVMKDFPVEMQGDIAMHMHREVLSLPIFENASQGCLKAIALMIKPMFCAPGEYIIHKGDVMTCIYFVINGSMEILKESMVVAILGKGDLFGTDVGYTDPIVKSNCEVKSLTYCDLLCIPLDGLHSILAMYPEMAEKFETDLVHDLTYILREGY